MTTPEQGAVCERILTAVNATSNPQVHLTTKDGLVFEVNIVKTGSDAHPTYNVSASAPVTKQNEDLGLTSVMLSQGMWERSTDCTCGDPECEEHASESLEVRQHMFHSSIGGRDMSEAAKKLYQLLRRVTDLKACSCKTFFITDGGDTCFDCALKTAADAGARADRGMCCICHESVTTDSATLCCKQPMHAACLERALERSPACPMCRGQPVASKRARTRPGRGN